MRSSLSSFVAYVWVLVGVLVYLCVLFPSCDRVVFCLFPQQECANLSLGLGTPRRKVALLWWGYRGEGCFCCFWTRVGVLRVFEDSEVYYFNTVFCWACVPDELSWIGGFGEKALAWPQMWLYQWSFGGYGCLDLGFGKGGWSVRWKLIKFVCGST